MKWSIVILILVGFVAAISVGLMTASLTLRARERVTPVAETKDTVLVAAANLKAMTIIDKSMLRETKVPKKETPQGAFTNPLQVVGRTLAVPVVEGQALTEARFVQAGPGFEVAAHLTPGMRAVTISLAQAASLKGLIYPGGNVDVVATFKTQGVDNPLGEAVSTTLLENIQVLAVDSYITGSVPDGSKTGQSDQTRRSMVTLNVTSDQAEALQLAVEYGAVSLSMRNPRDVTSKARDATLLNRGKLARLADVLEARSAAAGRAEARRAEAAAQPQARTTPAPAPAAEAVTAAPESRRLSEWNIDIYRGMNHEVQTFSDK